MKIKDVFFDLDHTLWDFERNSALAMGIVFDKHRVALDLELFLSHYVPINAKYWEQYRLDLISQEELRLRRLKDTFELLHYFIEDEQIMFLAEEYIMNLPVNNHLFEGAIAILDYLEPKYNLHIITNGFDTVQEQKLQKANIKHYFKTITNSQLAGAKKPHPQIFEYAMSSANASKSTSIMIGDCPIADVKGALDFGMKAILFNPNTPEIITEAIQISNLLEIKNHL